MIQKNLLTKQKETHRLRKQNYSCREKSRMVMYTLLYLKWITKKDLLWSTWNSAQCYMSASMWGRGWGRMDTCLCMVESLCYSHENITTLLIGYTPIWNKNVKRKKKTDFVGFPTLFNKTKKNSIVSLYIRTFYVEQNFSSL